MKKITIIFISIVFSFYLQAQTITKEEIECIDALILAKTELKKYKVDIDNYTLARCFEDTSLEKNNTKLITQLNELKTNDDLRKNFYGHLRFYYDNYFNELAKRLDVYTFINNEKKYIVDENSMKLFILSIINSKNVNHKEYYEYKILDDSMRKKRLENDTIKNVSQLSKVFNDTIFMGSEENAMYPGGDVMLFYFIKNKFIYPTYEKKMDIKGKVLVRFVVEGNGSVSNVEVLKKVSPGLDCEAVKLIKMMPKWTPAKNNGKPVRLYFNLPINFTLQ